MEVFSTWLVPILAVGLLAALTLGFALFIGRWIDAQSNTVVDKPRQPRKRKRDAGDMKRKT